MNNNNLPGRRCDYLLESQSIHERLAALELLTAKLVELQTREAYPIDKLVMISSTQPYFVDYRERKHLFVLSPTNITLSLEDYGTLALTAGVWVNLGLPTGYRLLVPASSSLVPLYTRCTDEVLP